MFASALAAGLASPAVVPGCADAAVAANWVAAAVVASWADVAALAGWAWPITLTCLIGCAAAEAVNIPPAAIAASASAGAVRAIVNLDVDVRVRDREEDKVNSLPGTRTRAQLPPGTTALGDGSADGRGSGLPDASRVQGDQ